MTPPEEAHVPVSSSFSDWRDATVGQSMKLIAEGITDVVGFGVAAVNVVRGDDLVVAAIAGVERARTVAGVENTLDEMLGTRWPVELYLAELELADDWGMFKFVPHDRVEESEVAGWVPDMVPVDAPDAWHPLDLLTAPIYDAEGVLRGSLAIDVPGDGRRPGPAKRRLMEKYAVQASHAVLTALEHEELAEQVRMLTTAREVIRQASANLDLACLLAETRQSLVAGFRADGLWLLTFDGERAQYGLPDGLHDMDPLLAEPAAQAAREAWARQETVVVTPSSLGDLDIAGAGQRRTVELFAEHDVSAMLYVPIGAGPSCLGSFVVVRRNGRAGWSDAEREVALAIGHDLGRAIGNARVFERERRLAEELRELNEFRERLIATLSDELRGPISGILANLSQLSERPLSPAVGQSVAAVYRGANRLVRIADDLALLNSVADPGTPLVLRPVPLVGLVEDAVELFSVTAEQNGVTVSLSAAGDDPLVAVGDADELDRVVTNLLSNAVKYTPDGGAVRVAVRRAGSEIVLEVADEGLGISSDDLPRLFTEFFRSTNPRAKALPGTGLGLAIVDRIVTRHRGRVEVDSSVGRGSVFRVFLPAAS